VPIKESDEAAMRLLDRAAVTYQLVLTKADGVKPPALAKKMVEVEAVARAHPAAHPLVIATSAATGLGIEALRAELARLV
jgi:GTP-binding protein